MVDGGGLSNAERAVWMFAGVAVMIAAVAALRAGTQQDAAPATPLMSVVASAPTVQASQPAPRATASAPVSLPDRSESAQAKPSAARAASGDPRTTTRAAPVAPRATLVATSKASAASTTGGKAPQRSNKAATVAAPDGFDTNAARRALASAAGRASRCGASGTRGSVIVTFAPSGLVQSASLAQISGEDVRRACVLRAFQSAQIAPYVGTPVTVRKSFQLR